MYGEPKHKENCLPSTSKFANCKGDHISTDKNCLIYRKEYKMKHEHLMAFENLAMSDARKLVHKNPIKIINSGIENFSILKEKFFTLFNEVVKEQKHICINTKERLQNKSTPIQLPITSTKSRVKIMKTSLAQENIYHLLTG